MNNAIIRTENLEKVYTNGKVKTHALRGLTLAIQKGSFVAIVGPSGHGKSTLLHLIGGLDRPTKGNIFLHGTDLGRATNSELAMIRWQKIGFVFQFFNLLPHLTAKENVETAMMFAGLKKGMQAERAKTLLSLVRLENKMQSRPSELSGGQQQRVALARALANDPEILLLDEPTGNLDSESEAEVLEHILALRKKGRTIIIVTHNNEIAKKAETVFEIRDGMLF